MGACVATSVFEDADFWTSVSGMAAAVTLLISIWSNYEMKRPQVVASLELDTDKNSVELIVHYYGNKPAYNLRFASFSNGIVMSEFRDLVCSSFVRKGIPVLIPGARRFTIVAAGAGMQKLANERATVQLVYEEKLPLGFRRRVREEFVLDYVSFSGALYQGSEANLSRRALEEVNRSLKKIASSLSRIDLKLEANDGRRPQG